MNCSPASNSLSIGEVADTVIGRAARPLTMGSRIHGRTARRGKSRCRQGAVRALRRRSFLVLPSSRRFTSFSESAQAIGQQTPGSTQVRVKAAFRLRFPPPPRPLLAGVEGHEQIESGQPKGDTPTSARGQSDWPRPWDQKISWGLAWRSTRELVQGRSSQYFAEQRFEAVALAISPVQRWYYISATSVDSCIRTLQSVDRRNQGFRFGAVFVEGPGSLRRPLLYPPELLAPEPLISPQSHLSRRARTYAALVGLASSPTASGLPS
jgi:hypothetical protein